MDAFPFIFAGTTAGAAAFSAYAAYRSFRGIKTFGFQISSLTKKSRGNAGGLAPAAQTLDDDDQAIKKFRLPQGVKRTNILSVFPNCTIRTRDGGYIRGYKFRAAETFYASDDEVRRLYDRLSLMLTSGLPKNAVIQIRFDNQPDAGNLLNDQLMELAAGGTDCDPVAQLLKQEELNYYFELAAADNFRTGSFQAWVYLPAQERRGSLQNGWAASVESLFKGEIREACANFWRNEKTVVCRYLADEEHCYTEAARLFRTFERNFPLPLKRLSFDETAVHLRLSHNPGALSMPPPPRELETDWQSYLCRTGLRHNRGDWFLWHGNTPVTVISLFEPPESNSENPVCYPGIMRFFTANPTLRSRLTVLSEFAVLDKDESVAKLKKDVRNMRRANSSPQGGVKFKDDKTKREYDEKVEMLKELTSPGKALTNLRFHVVLRGREVRYKEDRTRALRELEEQAHEVIKLIHENMNGAQADLEDPEALSEIYEKTLLGEITPALRHREIKEQALSLSCFIPGESDWRGVLTSPHSFFVNTSGELVGVNLLRNPFAAAPLTLVLGSSGSGKSVFAARLISDFLSSIPHARVRACDYGGSLAPLVNLFQGRYFRFSDKDKRAINIWDYDGLERGTAPEDAQIELVVKDTLILLGVDERSELGKDFISVLDKCVRQVYRDEIPRNDALSGRRHEPRLSHLIRKLRSFPFESKDERQIAQRMAARLDSFEGNPWVDAETHSSYRQNSRFDVYELSSLEKMPDSLKSCLAFRIGARVGTGDDEIEGIHPPTLVVFDEVHELTKNAYLSQTLKGAENTTRHGRKKNKVPLLITHSLDDIADYPGFLSNIGTLFVGKQDDLKSLKDLRKWNQTIEQTVLAIDNQKGVAHQFLYATGQGETQKITAIQIYLSPLSLWTYTTDPPEDEARKIVAQALPHWTWAQVLVALARRYERGLTAVGKNKLDEDWLQEIVRAEETLNPQYRQYLKQMKKLGHNIFELPEEIDFDELAEEAIDAVEREIERIRRDNFIDLSESGNPRNAAAALGKHHEFEVPAFSVEGAFIKDIYQEETKNATQTLN